ncbi:phage late control D family protein [Roseinatronobacter sp.]
MWRVNWKVFIDGRDMSAAMRPFLTDITVTDKDGTASDSCQLSFDDAEGQVLLPRDGAAVQVYLQGASIFQGKTDSVRSSGSRGGGRMLEVTAKGMDVKGDAKTGQRWHMDDASLQDVLGKAARRAGLSGVVVDPAIASIVRDYWSPDGASFVAWGQTLARELGATFKIRGDMAVLVRRGQGASVSGVPMPTVRGEVGRNVITWDISPITSRGKFKTVKVRYFDRASATFKIKEVQTGIADAVAVNDARTSAVDEEQATSIAEGGKAESEREGGEGSVELDLTVDAQAEGTFVLSGARPGVDGSYRIVGVTHRASRNGGSTTSLELKQPQGAAGSDGRA